MNVIKFAPHSNRADFSESWQALDENNDPIDLTGATIVFRAQDKNSSDVLSGSTTGGEITISTTTFTLAFAVADVSDIDPGEYEVGCTIEIDDFVTQFFVGTLPIVDGVVP